MFMRAAVVLTVVCVQAVGVCAQVGGALPRPEGLSDDVSVWPNVESWRNSDAWLAEHHGEIREMRPRVVVVNFANEVGMEAVREHAEGVVGALAEGSRWHGYEDAGAPAFLKYEVVRYVDLRDGSVAAGGARTSPGSPGGGDLPGEQRRRQTGE
jgi:hypothetical protein